MTVTHEDMVNRGKVYTKAEIELCKASYQFAYLRPEYARLRGIPEDKLLIYADDGFCGLDLVDIETGAIVEYSYSYMEGGIRYWRRFVRASPLEILARQVPE